ncbi:MAG: AAA family ATPase [Thermomicrobiales bacterium]
MDLLERTTLMAQLNDHLSEAAAGHGRLVLVGGEAGVGKSSLVEAFARQARGATVMRVSCDALSTPGPLGPLRDLAPTLGLPLDQFTAEGDARDHLFRAVLAAYAARPDPTLFIGEDAHWADGASLDLLRFLARRIGDLSTLFVVTYRDDEIGGSHPLRLLLGDLATAPTVHRLSVPPLSEEAVARLAAASGRNAADLHRLTGGNPFFLTEVLARSDASVPASVGDAILARAARLTPEARAVLDIAAVIGTTIDLDLLLTVAGPVFEETEACLAGGLLRADGARLLFRHDLVREAVLAAIAPPRRRLLHGRVLTVLREASEAERDLALLAHHAEAAGDRDAVLTFAVAAGGQASALHAHREAAAQYARALRFADRLPSVERVALYEQRSVACYLIDQGDEAIAARRAALDIWRSLGDPLREGDSLRWMSRLFWYSGHGAEAERAAIDALALLEPLPPGPELAMAYSNLSQLRMLADDTPGALEWGERAIALADQLGETETLIHALTNVGTARVLHDVERAEVELRRSIRLAIDQGFVDHAGRAQVNLAWTALRTMHLDEAARRTEAALAYATDHDLDNYRFYLLATQAAIRMQQGRWDEAQAELQPLPRQPGVSPLTRMVAMTTLGRIAVRRGAPEAGELLDGALELAERTGQLMRIEPVRAARAEAALLAGDVEAARGELLAIRDQVFARGTEWQRGELAWRLWLCGEREFPREQLAIPYALQIEGDFVTAAAAWRDLGCPYEEARALVESGDPRLQQRGAEALARLGVPQGSPAAIERRHGPDRTAAIPSAPLGLTTREVEVLRLLVAGYSNREIGDHLYISPATAARHVANIYLKLEVDSRAEATALAVQYGIA